MTILNRGLRCALAIGVIALVSPAAAQPTPGQPVPAPTRPTDPPDPSKPLPPTDPSQPTLPTPTDPAPTTTDPTRPVDPTIPTTTDPARPLDPNQPVTPPGTPTLPEPAPVPTEPLPEPAGSMPTTDVPADQPVDGGRLTRYGVSLTAGGGVEGFTNSSLRDTTTDGGNWDVRAVFGTRSPLAFEASYIGSAQAINALGLDNDAVLVGNGVQGDVRFNIVPDGIVQPFLFAGVAWRRYDLTNTSINTSDVADSDDVLEIPMGVGLGYRYRGLVLDARGEFRASTREDLMPTLNSTDPDDKAAMHRWGVNANIGVEF